MAIFSLQVEKHVLAGIIRNPDVFCEIAPFVSDKDFYNDVHCTIFLVIKSCFDKNESWNKVTLSEKIKNLGVAFKDDINIHDYIENLSFIQITKNATIDDAKELVKLRVRRELHDTGENIKNYSKQCGNKSLDEIISGSDSIYGNITDAFEYTDSPVNLFSDIESKIEERGNNPITDFGLVSPYPEFNRLYGGFRNGNIYAFASRPGQGKTTILNDLCFHVGRLNNAKVLVCDTEMATEEIQFRQAAARSGVSLWHIETGQWRKNKEMVEKVRNALKEIKQTDFYFHYHVGNKPIDQVVSIIRRWYYKYVGRGNKCIICYDYLKLTGELVSKNWAEHQVLGEKVDKIKKLSEELGCPIVTAIQLNRTGENFNKSGADVTDDSSAIAISDRLQWFASFVAIFRRKTLDEINLDGEQFGTHKLIPIKTRFQGRDAAGHHDIVRRRNLDGEFKYTNNYLNFSISNFAVQEHGSLHDIVALENSRFELDDTNQEDGGTIGDE